MPKNDLKTPKNEILKVAKNAEKSHFYTEKCHFEVIFSPFQNLIFGLHNPTHYRSKSKKGLRHAQEDIIGFRTSLIIFLSDVGLGQNLKSKIVS